MQKFILAISLFGICNFTFAETQYEKYEEEIKFTREAVAKQRRDKIEKGMNLGDDQKKAFWGIYDRYKADMEPIIKLEIKIITDYADAYVNKTLTDKQAIYIVETMIEVKASKLAIRKKYIKEFQEALSPKQVARFMQLENKLDAIMNFDLARKIPLIPD